MQVAKPLTKTPERDNLVVVRAGLNSFHPDWLSGLESIRNWDLLVSWYEPVVGWREFDSEGCLLHQGNKLAPLKGYWEQGWFKDYEYVWFPDPDIEIKGQSINLLFSAMKLFDLDLAQPSLSLDSYTSHPITLSAPESILRYTTFVEMMQPCFSQHALDLCAPTFDANHYMWGIDHVWAKLLGYPLKKIAILDKIISRHTAPVGSSYDIQLAYKEMFATLSKYDVGVQMEVLDQILG
jgi:hypothetical protein